MVDSSKENLNAEKQISPPESVRGINQLNYDLFRKQVTLPYVVTDTHKNIPHVSNYLKPFFLKIQLFKPVQKCPALTDHHRIYLNPDLLNNEAVSKIEDLKLSGHLIESTKDKSVIQHENYELKYEHFNHHTVLRSILPEEIDSVTGFSTIGHIIHLNLRDDAQPYKHIIGQVLLDKVKGCRLVINKLNIIDNEFRNFKMEILAKDKNDPPVSTVVDTTESEIRFRFDFANVYWNPRLSAERSRINSKLLRSVDVMYDVFAGVGPFAISAAKFMKCRVIANDLNPESYRWLCENVQLNKVSEIVCCTNLDGREFIRTKLKDDLIDCVDRFDGSDLNRSYHVVMNLPDIAFNFLDQFYGLLSSTEEQNNIYKIPFLKIHCYCFVKNVPENEAEDYVAKLASNKIGCNLLPEDIDEVYYVRKVAPNKIMYRLSFRLSQDILYGLKPKDIEESYSNDCIASKRPKIE